MSAPYIRTYQIRFVEENKCTQKAACDIFHQFVEKVARNGREVHEFKPVYDGNKCEVSLKVTCVSSGKLSPNRLARNVKLQYPTVSVTHIVRDREK